MCQLLQCWLPKQLRVVTFLLVEYVSLCGVYFLCLFVAEMSVCKLLLGMLANQLVAAQLSLFPSKSGVPHHVGRGEFPSPGCPPQASSEPAAHPALASAYQNP